MAAVHPESLWGLSEGSGLPIDMQSCNFDNFTAFVDADQFSVVSEELLDPELATFSFAELVGAPVGNLTAGQFGDAPGAVLDMAARPAEFFYHLVRPTPFTSAPEPFPCPFEPPAAESSDDDVVSCPPSSLASLPPAEAFSSAVAQLEVATMPQAKQHAAVQGATRQPARRRKTARTTAPSSRSSSCSDAFETVVFKQREAETRAEPTREAASIKACQVCGEPVDANSIRKYIRCRKVCNSCRTSLSVMKGGKEMRYCQLCSWFHGIEKFDGERHSCRNALEQHNKRRRSKSAAKQRAGEDST